ncbi:DUF2529 family protein [Alkalicoccus chagannorensis]|uniref:DUF2529 family protein n=1 Tax=Alkalicoccus chagannorensis TaxID=427072 RepID=UPI00041937DF|nr:DUF2529 family protein [Alkalicoccus chagannorensis]
MKKIFNTQFSNVLKQQEGQDDVLEDAARITSMCLFGAGSLYVAASPALGGIVSQAVHGADALDGCERLMDDTELTAQDAVWIFAESPAHVHDELLRAADAGAGIILVIPEKTDDPLCSRASALLETKVTRPLIPKEDGSRFGEPHLLAALHVYYDLFFLMDEFQEEFDEE